MTDPVTHLLWGYVVARRFSADPKYLAVGVLAGLLLDLDALVPGLVHHGWIHTPLLVLAATGLVFLLTRDRLLAGIALGAMMAHLALDTVATQDPVMWLWPVHAEGWALWTLDTMAGLAVVKVFLFVGPALWMWERWKQTGESPLAVLRWVEARVPRPVVYTGAATFGGLMVLVFYTRYLWMLVVGGG